MSEDGGSGGNIWTKKIGPMPGWAWGGLLLGGLLAMSTWSKNKQGAAAAKAAAPASISGQPLPSNVVPQYTFVDESTVNVHIPPTGGRPPVPPVPPVTAPPIMTPPPPPPPDDDDRRRRRPPPPPVYQPPPPPPGGRWVSIIPWGNNQGAGTPSTLWGLAENVYGLGHGPQWQNIWNAPQNADLRSRRGDPRNIRPGDNFFVPL